MKLDNSYIPVLRRIAEATSAKLNYDYLCFKGPLMDESYLTYNIADTLSSFYFANSHEIKKNYTHPVLRKTSKLKGRKPEIDYVVLQRGNSEICLAIEAKWAGSSHCTEANILWDLVRLKIFKDKYPSATCGFLVAGHKNKFQDCFERPLFKPGSQRPLNQDNTKRKCFSLNDNKNHQDFINDQLNIWKANYPSLDLPNTITTCLKEYSLSAATYSRFIAKVWEIR